MTLRITRRLRFFVAGLLLVKFMGQSDTQQAVR